jgi:RNA polymerase sigma factor (sigma-70 family)
VKPVTAGRTPGAIALAELLRRIADEDRAAFAELYRLTSAKLLGVCLRILERRTEAEEALQDAYLSVWRRAGAFDDNMGSAMTWMITIARNRAIDRRRAIGMTTTVPIELAFDVADTGADAAEGVIAEDETRRLFHCLGELEANDAGFIRTAFLQGSTYADLAQHAAVPLGTVKSRIRRALLKLRACLQ